MSYFNTFLCRKFSDNPSLYVHTKDIIFEYILDKEIRIPMFLNYMITHDFS